MKQWRPSWNTSSLSVDSVRLSTLPESSSCSHSAMRLLNFQAVRHRDAKWPNRGIIVAEYKSAGLSTDSRIMRFRKERKPDSVTRLSLLIAGPCLPATESRIPRQMVMVDRKVSFRRFVTLPCSVRPTSYAVDLTTVWYI